MLQNELYLTVLPIVYVQGGPTIQVLTLFPDRSLATEFFSDEVKSYVTLFERQANYHLVGGHVKSYKFEEEPTEDGRVVVKVIQNVEA
jgi:hypothetical protein